VELGHGEPLLKLNGVAAHDWSGICVLLWGLARGSRSELGNQVKRSRCFVAAHGMPG
jgi:hypothetical protein